MGPPDPFLPTPSHPDSGYKNHWEPTCLLFPQGQGSSERKLSFWWGLPPAFFSDLPGFFRLCECELLYYPFSIPCLYAGPHLRVPGAQQSPSPFISWPALPPLPLISSALLILHSWLFPRDAARAMAGTLCPSPPREAEERCADSSARPGLCLCFLLGLQDVWATWTWSQAGEQGTWSRGRPPWCWLSRPAKK